MNIVQITPGAGGMYCGGCFRDNALVGALRRMNHHVLMVPLYLPLTLDEGDQSAGTPIFFNGINVYLDQKSRWYRHAPEWMHRLLASPALLKLVAGAAASTRPQETGDLTVSMLRGEDGNQARELRELIAWLKANEKPDVICLSNALLAGMARELKRELGVPVICFLQGEDYFLDSLSESYRDAAWNDLAERAADVDLFIAPSHYFGELMRRRLHLPAKRVRVVYNGINLDGYAPAVTRPNPPVLGYFARMCIEKGLETLIETFIRLRERGRVPALKLKVGGGCGPADEPFVETLRARLKQHGLLGEVEFHRNLDRAAKQAFLRSLTVFCTPALYGEAFGLYVIEALASGVPVVQPRHAAFPELVEATGGGELAEPDAHALAEAVERLLLQPDRVRALGEAGLKAVREKFSIERMAREVADLCAKLAEKRLSTLHPQPAT